MMTDTMRARFEAHKNEIGLNAEVVVSNSHDFTMLTYLSFSLTFCVVREYIILSPLSFMTFET